MSIRRRISLRLLAKLQISSRSVSARSSSPSYPSMIPSSRSRACWSFGNNPSISLAENLGILVSDQALLRTHVLSHPARVNRALGNKPSCITGTTSILVLNLLISPSAMLRITSARNLTGYYVRRATSIFRERPAEGFLQEALSASRGQSRAYFREYFSTATVRRRIHCASVECADCVGDLVAGSNGYVSLKAPPPPAFLSLCGLTGMSLQDIGHKKNFAGTIREAPAVPAHRGISTMFVRTSRKGRLWPTFR